MILLSGLDRLFSFDFDMKQAISPWGLVFIHPEAIQSIMLYSLLYSWRVFHYRTSHIEFNNIISGLIDSIPFRT